jgi:subtilisin-like proprotein convertase family protein
VTNLSERTVYLGNDIPPGAGFNQCATATALRDVVNNIENVYLQPPLAAAYSIAVIGRRVNVNAVAARMDVAQDYALVVASGNGEAANALSLLGSQTGQAEPGVVTLTNVFGEGTTDYGAFLTRQVAGDNSPALPTASIPLAGVNGQITLGSPAQWRFYTITNQGGCTNAAFFTFNARTTSYVQTAGTNRVAAVRADADVDLYVSTDPALTNLHPVAVASAEKSLSRGGNEMVVLSNAVPAVYYLGVKSETMRGVEFGVAAIFGEQPFSDTDSDGNLHVRGIPTAKPVPDGAPYQEPAALVFAIADRDLPIHRVIVTNSVSHSAPADLVGILSHDDISVVLNNHAALPPGTHTWVFDDSAQLDMLGAVPSAGPGSLRDFVVHSAYGAWVLSQTDTVPGGTGTNDNLGMFFEREQDLTTGVTATILPGACREDLMYVPVQATNLTLNLSLVSGTGPVLIEFCPLVEANECLSTNLRASNVSLSLALDAISDPPLHPGTYVLRCCNTGADPAVVDALAALTLDPGEPHTAHFRQNTAVSIVDDGLTWSTLTVTNVGRIAGLNVGVGIEHPRVSDLEISLLSPAGTRVLLAQNRGGLSEEGLGLPIIVTTEADKHSDGGPAAYTNTIDTAQMSGIVSIRYAFYSKPDSLRVYYEGNRIFDSGMVSLGGVWTIPYGPGTSTKLTIVVNEGNNYDPETLWDYWFTSTKPDFLCAEFTEDANLTVTPIKFAIPPFTNALATGSPPGTNGIYFLPEESLEKFKGEIASGDWRLEITDTRAGAIDPNPMLVAWQLCFLVDPGVPLPLLLSHGMPRSQTVRPGHFRFFVVDVPSWASFTTNSLLGGSGPVLLLFNRYALPFGTNAPGDLTLLTNTSSGSAVLGPGQIAPENSYFLTVQNTSSVPVTFVLQTDFETPALSDMVPREFAVPGGQSRYFAFDVSPDALRASVMLTSLTANGDLVVQKGVPLPTLSSYDYASFNPETNSELILLVPESTPVPLSEGRWYVGVFNMDATNLTGTLLFNQLAPPAGTIVITDYRVENDSLCLTWTSLPGRDYLLQGRSDLLPSSQWVTLPLPPIAASGNRTSTCVPFSAGYYYLRVCEAP